MTYQVPVGNTDEQPTTDDVTDESWDQALPDVIADGNLLVMQKNRYHQTSETL